MDSSQKISPFFRCFNQSLWGAVISYSNHKVSYISIIIVLKITKHKTVTSKFIYSADPVDISGGSSTNSIIPTPDSLSISSSDSGSTPSPLQVNVLNIILYLLIFEVDFISFSVSEFF